jgi:hypothetical protein
MAARQAVIDDRNLVVGVSELGHDFLLNHARIRNYVSGAPLAEQCSLEFKDLGMFAVQETKVRAPTRLMRNPTFEPEFVDAVAGSVTVASKNPVQTEQDFVRMLVALDRLCEAERARGIRADQWSIGPFSLGPIPCRVKDRFVAGFCKRPPEPFQITFRATGARESASDQTDFHRRSAGVTGVAGWKNGRVDEWKVG